MSLRDVIFGHCERATLQKALDSQEGQCPKYWRAMLSSVVAGHDAEDKNYWGNNNDVLSLVGIPRRKFRRVFLRWTYLGREVEPQHSRTESLRPLALQKFTRYLSEKVRATGSDRLISTLRSGFSTSVCERSVTAPEPMSPLQANLTPSLVHSMDTVPLKSSEISADSLELRARHVDGSRVLSPVAVRALKDHVHNVRCILRLQGQDILILCTAQDLLQRGQVDAEGNVTVAAERREGLGLQHHGHESHMGVVHGLESDAGVIAVEVAVLDQVLDGVDDLH
ncbi:Proliferating cell nuclear [Hortaea werneckii]|nr:Proliferating cell nuclear [Hortaea werneckii]